LLEPEDELDKNYLKNNKNGQNQNGSISIELSVHQLVHLAGHAQFKLFNKLFN